MYMLTLGFFYLILFRFMSLNHVIFIGRRNSIVKKTIMKEF
jgi:hypothetical protein